MQLLLIKGLNMENAIIVDIDGTLSDHSYRVKFAEAKQYKTYYSLCGNDLPRQHIVDIVNQLSKENKIILLTGRPETYRKITEYWLIFNKINYDLLLMRPNGDLRKDYIYKEDFYHKFIEGKYNVVKIFDDRETNINMFRNLGLNTIKV